jgi:hypothetical protein
VLFIIQHSQLPFVFPGRNIEDVLHQLSLAVGAVLKALGIPVQAIRAELGSMADAVLTPTNSRSHITTLTDLSYSLNCGSLRSPRREPCYVSVVAQSDSRGADELPDTRLGDSGVVRRNCRTSAHFAIESSRPSKSALEIDARLVAPTVREGVH